LKRVDKRTNVTLNYTYDPIYQLQTAKQGTATKESYTDDLVGNRLSSLGVSPYTYNSSNELTSIPGTAYNYDNNGSLTSKSDGTAYSWDFENRLTQVTLPGSGGTVNFKYDPFGRRVQKAFLHSATTTTTNYVYDGPNAIEEVDANGAVLARYTQGLGIDEPLAELRASTTSYYDADGLRSITSLSNAAGALANTYTYDAFGRLTASTGSTANPFQYTARDYDGETGLRYYRARYYDQNTGRFLSEDPIGIARRSANFYTYAGNNPVILSDPLGLSEQCTLIGSHNIFSINLIEPGRKSPWVLGGSNGIDPEMDDVGPTGAGSEEPGLWPLATVGCLWARNVSRETWRHTLVLRTYDCVDSNCPKKHYRKHGLGWEKHFVSMTTDVERIVEPIPSWPVGDQGEAWYEYECLFYRPRD
jgi:RHS repeat-associated protein